MGRTLLRSLHNKWESNLAEIAVYFELESDLLMALESTSEALSKVIEGNHCYLKWTVIFGHTALQSAMCLSLITTASFLVRKKSSYGGQVEICALSHVLNRNINVYKSYGDNYTTAGLGYTINPNNNEIKKLPTTPEYVFFGLTLVNLGPLNILPKI